MLTVPEAARQLGKNPETIRRWIREGRLQSRKVGTQHVIEEQDLRRAAGIDAETLPSPDGWHRMLNGEPMPDVVAAIRRSRVGH